MKYLDEISDRKLIHVVNGGGAISASQPLITLTYLAYTWTEGGSHGSLSTNERAIYQSESMGAGEEADGYSKDHRQLESRNSSRSSRHVTLTIHPISPRAARPIPRR